MKMQVVLNKDFGCFSLSQEVYNWLVLYCDWTVVNFEDKETFLKNNPDSFKFLIKLEGNYYHPFESSLKFRSDPDLIEVITFMGLKASAPMSKLEIVEIDLTNLFEIISYDGKETLKVHGQEL